MHTLKFSIRTLLKSPAVTIVAVVSLALGIGATAAIFSLFRQTLLQPLPVPQPERLVNLVAPGPKPGSQSCGSASTHDNCDDVFSYQMFRDLERTQTVFTALAAHRLTDVNITFKKATINDTGLLVSGGYFPALALHAALGRLIGPGDDASVGQSPIVVLSYRYWQRQLGANPDVLNQVLTVDGQQLTIVGVAPEGFDGTTIGAEPKVFVPVTMRALLEPTFKGFDDRSSYSFYLFARLKPGVSLDRAKATLEPQYRAIINDVEAPLQKGMSPQTLARFRSKPLLMDPGDRGQSIVPQRAGPALRLLLGVTAFVLVIACANIANLLLARSAARAGEMAVRLSIGAGRLQLIRQLLTESLVLALFGGIAGMFVARWTLDVIASLLPARVTAGLVWRVDGSVMIAGAALTVGAGLLFGLFPAIHSTRPDVAAALKGQAGQPSGARGAARFRAGLATTQMALSMTLLVAAGLFTKSLMNISHADLGVKIDNVATFRISPGLNGYSPERNLALFERLEDELHALPGVTGVTDSLVGVITGNNWGNSLVVEGFPAGPDTDTNSRYNEVAPDFFRSLGMPLIRGREFTRADAKDAQKVAVVNEAFAKKFNLGHDVIGKHIGNRGKELDTLIVGFVQNAKYSDVKREVPPVYFRPIRQGDTPALGTVAFYVRSSMDPDQLLPAIAKTVARIDPNLPVADLRSMPEQIRQTVYLDRMISVLSAAFAVLATVLAAIGLYGVLAYTVSQRTREIGLRMALGAAPMRVRAMILRQVGVMTLAGGVVGLAAAIWLGRLGESLLFQMKGWDPAVLGGASVALTIVALLAGLIPAYRASRVDPMRALRCE